MPVLTLLTPLCYISFQAASTRKGLTSWHSAKIAPTRFGLTPRQSAAQSAAKCVSAGLKLPAKMRGGGLPGFPSSRLHAVNLSTNFKVKQDLYLGTVFTKCYFAHIGKNCEWLSCPHSVHSWKKKHEKKKNKTPPFGRNRTPASGRAHVSWLRSRPWMKVRCRIFPLPSVLP